MSKRTESNRKFYPSIGVKKDRTLDEISRLAGSLDCITANSDGRVEAARRLTDDIRASIKRSRRLIPG